MEFLILLQVLLFHILQVIKFTLKALNLLFILNGLILTLLKQECLFIKFLNFQLKFVTYALDFAYLNLNELLL